MRIKALKNFTGIISMSAGETTNCRNETAVRDLVAAGYVELLEAEEESTEEESAEEESTEEKAPNKKTRKSEKNET